MSKTLKIVLGVIFTFTAIIYLVNIGAKSFEDANSIGRLISHLVIGVLVGGSVALGLLQAESQQHIAANRWVTEKLNNHFNAVFIAGVISLLCVAVSKSVYETTQSSWYVANEISNNGVEICDEHAHSGQIEKSYDRFIKLAKTHFTSQEILLMACESAMSSDIENESYETKVAKVNISLGKLEGIEIAFETIKEEKNRNDIINKLVHKNEHKLAKTLISTIEDENQKVSLLDKLGKKYLALSQFDRAEDIYEGLHSDSYYVGYYGLQTVYDAIGKYEKSINVLEPLLEWQVANEKDASYTYASLAKYYARGLGIEKDLTTARTYYSKGLSHLNGEQRQEYARMLYEGIGGGIIKEKAIELGYVTPEMKKIKDIKRGKGVIVRGSYICETYSSIQRLTQLEKSYGSLQYISRALPADCFDLIRTLKITGEIPIQLVTQERNEFIQVKIKNSGGNSAWINLDHVVIK